MSRGSPSRAPPSVQSAKVEVMHAVSGARCRLATSSRQLVQRCGRFVLGDPNPRRENARRIQLLVYPPKVEQEITYWLDPATFLADV